MVSILHLVQVCHFPFSSHCNYLSFPSCQCTVQRVHPVSSFQMPGEMSRHLTMGARLASDCTQSITHSQYHSEPRPVIRRRREFAGFVKSHIFNYYIAKYFQKLWKQISECQRNALSLNKYVTQWEYGEDKQKCHGGKFSIERKMRFYVGRKNSVISFKLVQRNLHSDTTNTHLLY